MYEVALPDGTIIEVPDEMPPQEARKRILKAFPQFADKSRTYGESAADLGVALLKGTGILGQFPGQLLQLAPGFYDAGSRLATPGRLLEEKADTLYSEGTQARAAEQQKKIAEADKEGFLSGLGTAVGTTISDPALAAKFFGEQVPLLVGPGAAAKIARIAKAGSVARAGVGLEGLAAENAIKAAKESADKVAYRAAMGTGAAMQSADVGNDAFNEAMAELARQFPEMPEKERQELALSSARRAAGIAAAFSGVSMLLPGAGAIEARLAGLPGRGRISSALGEAGQEMVEEGGGQFGKNYALQAIDPTRSLTEGLGSAVGLGALGGGVLGGILGNASPESLRAQAERLQAEIGALRALEQTEQTQQALAEKEQQMVGLQSAMTAAVSNEARQPRRGVSPELGQLMETNREQQGIAGILAGQKSKGLAGTTSPGITSSAESLAEFNQLLVPTISPYATGLESALTAAETSSGVNRSATTASLAPSRQIMGQGSRMPFPTGLESALEADASGSVNRASKTPSLAPSQQVMGQGTRMPFPTGVNAAVGVPPKKSLRIEPFTLDALAEIPWEAKSFTEVGKPMLKTTGSAKIVDLAGRKIVLADVNGTQVPFYLSSGAGGKTKVPAGKWYPFFGVGADGWINKGSQDQIVSYYENQALADMAKQLDENIGDIRDDRTIPSVGATGRHIDAINGGMVPAENGRADTVERLQENVWALLGKVGQGPLQMPATPRGATEIPFSKPAEIDLDKERLAELQKNVALTEKQRRKVVRNSYKLWAVLRNKLDRYSVTDISPDKSYSALLNKNNGRDLSSLVADGEVDAFLPYNMRSTSPDFDEIDSTNYIKDLLSTSKTHLEYEHNIELRKLTESIDEMTSEINSLLNDKEANELIQQTYDEQRRVDQEADAAKPQRKDSDTGKGDDTAGKPAAPEVAKELTERQKLIIQKTQELQKVLQKMLGQMGMRDVALKITADLTDADGEYSSKLIRLAFDAANPLQTMRHEAIHALKALGFFSPKQWETLTKMAKDTWIPRLKAVDINQQPLAEGETSRYDAYVNLFTSENKTPAQIEEALLEEAIADAFGEFDATSSPPGLLAAIVKRMRNLFAALKATFSGDEDVEQIFRKIERGGMTQKNAWKASTEEKKKAISYAEDNDIDPYISEGRLDLPTKFSLKLKEKKFKDGTSYGSAPIINIPLNADGTVTVYYHTTKDKAITINANKVIPAEGRNRIYLTNESSGAKILGGRGNFDQTLDGSTVMLRIPPSLLQLDQSYPDGRKDFFVPLAQGEFFNRKMQAASIQAERTKAITDVFSYREHEDRIARAVLDYKRLNKKEKEQSLAQAKALLKKEHNVGTLLTENGKLEKTRMGGLLYEGSPIDSMGLGLAAAQQISGKVSSCPNSAICEGLCLGETSGGNFVYGGAAQEDVEDIAKSAFRAGPRMMQYLKTEALIIHPEEFAVVLQSEIEALQEWDQRATIKKKNKSTGKMDDVEKDIYQSAVRLNVTSDFRGEMWRGIIENNPNVIFYDYTKLVGNGPIGPNHYLTYSSTGFGQVVDGDQVFFQTKSGKYNHNWAQIRNLLNSGKNAAMAFSSKSSLPKFLRDEETEVTYKVLDGDEYDARFLDEASPLKQDSPYGVIVGLRNKASNLFEKTATKKTKGFFAQYNPKTDGDTVTVPTQTAFGAPPYQAPGKVIPIAKKSLRAPQTEAFKQWFGDSKVVDENGEPLVVYHATAKDFKFFDPKKLAKNTKHPTAKIGFFTAADPASTEEFITVPYGIRRGAYEEGANVMPLFASIKNPYVIDSGKFMMQSMALQNMKKKDADKFIVDFVQSLRDEGHDGILIKANKSGFGLAGGLEFTSDNWVVLDATQLKSATGNIGTYDATNPDIRKSLRAGYDYDAALKAKWKRMDDFTQDYPALLERINKDAADGKEAAIVLRLIAATGFRVGNPLGESKGEPTFGATSLRPEHITVNGDTVMFDFRGKAGIRQQHVIQDAAIADDLASRLDGRERLFKASDQTLRAYMEKLRGAKDYKIHDFRTWSATDAAQEAISQLATPTDKKQFQEAEKLVMEVAARKIGDLPATARKSYVHPKIFDAWREAAGLPARDAVQEFTGEAAEPEDRVPRSEGQPEEDAGTLPQEVKRSIRAPNTTEFKQWFGDSKVVDENGDPLVVYHGTMADITSFKPSKEGVLGAGVYLTPDPKFAENYSTENGNILPVFASLKNPLIIKITGYQAPARKGLVQLGMSEKAADKAVERGYEEYGNMRQELRSRALKQGYDGIMLYQDDSLRELVAFDNTDIKSAIGNQGTYNQFNPDIRKSIRAPKTKEFKTWFADSKIVDENGEPKVMYHGTARDINVFKPKQANAIFLTGDKEFAEGFASMSLDWVARNYKDMLTPNQLVEARAFAERLGRQTYGRNPKLVEQITKDLRQGKDTEDATDLIATAVKQMLDKTKRVMEVYVRAEKPFDYENADHIKQVADLLPATVRAEVAFSDEPGISYTKLDAIEKLKTGEWDIVESKPVQKAIRELNFDSFYVQEGGEKNIGVYNSNQIKSATDNEGTYDINNPDIRKSLRAPQTKEFKQWFDESKVVDENGDPLVVYHGGSVDEDEDAYTEFQGVNVWWRTDHPRWLTAIGDWFTENPQVADHFAQKESGTIYPVYLSIKKPITFQTYDDAESAYERSTAKTVQGWRDQLIKKGYDGIIIDLSDTDVDIVRKDYVTFYPNQTKSSTGNSGEYGLKTPDIRKSLRATEVPKEDAKKFWQGVENIERTEGVEAAEEAWIGGIADFGDRAAARDIQRMPGYQDYQDSIVNLARQHLAKNSRNQFYVYRYGNLGLKDEVLLNEEYGALDPKATTLSINFAKRFKHFAGFDEDLDPDANMGWMRIAIYPETIVMVGKPGENELVIDPNSLTVDDIEIIDESFEPSRPEGKFSLRSPIGLYSELETKIEGISSKQAPAAQWKTMINALPQKGVKPEEIEWSGVNDWLDAQGGKVSKDDLLNYLKEGGVRVEETVLSNKSDIPDELRRYMDHFGPLPEDIESASDYLNIAIDAKRDAQRYQRKNNQEEANYYFIVVEQANEMAERMETPSGVAFDATQYAKYTLPGGKNYQEVLLRLPVKQPKPKPYSYKEALEQLAELQNPVEVVDKDGKFVKNITSDWQLRDNRDKIDSGEYTLREYVYPDEKGQYFSSHWKQPNVLAHIRMNDRIDADGKKVLFVEEIQSDWGQEGKKQGFGKKNEIVYEVLNSRGVVIATQADRRVAEEGAANLGFTVREVEREASTGIPAAPFVTKTEGWLNLALKRIMVMAAEGGYDKVAFINGEQSADRYRLDKTVRNISWNQSQSRQDRGATKLVTIELMGLGNDIELPINKDGVVLDNVGTEFDGKPLESVIGKELAEQILTKKSGSINGNGLKVGGEGMKVFYDRIVIPAVKKLLPKVGGGQMGEVYFPAARLGQPKRTLPQPGFDVTPSMKQKVETTGLPKFSLRSSTGVGYHAGNLGYGTDTALGRMTGGRSTGHFGTGTYFTGTQEKLGQRAADRPIYEVSLAGYNLARPRTEDLAKNLHDGLRIVNDLTMNPDLSSRSSEEKLRKAAFDIWLALLPKGVTIEMLEEKLIPESIKQVAPLAEELYATSTYAESASTVLMRRLGYEGVDVRHLKAFDNTAYGTVVYGKQFQERSPDAKLSLRGTPAKAMPVISQAAEDAVTRTTKERDEKSFIRNILDAISPSSFTSFRSEFLNRYNGLSLVDKRRVQKMGGAAAMADVSAESAALLSDVGAGITAAVFGVEDKVGGAPVYARTYYVVKNDQVLPARYKTEAEAKKAAGPTGSVRYGGHTQVSNFNGTIKGPLAIFAPLAAYNNPRVYQHYQFWAAVKRGKRFTAEGREQLLTKNDIKLAEEYETAYPEFKSIQEEWTKYNNQLVQYMVDTGVLSQERANVYTEHSDYIPFYRQIEGSDKAVGPTVFSAISGVKPPKMAKGSTAVLDDFLETIVRNTQSAIQAGIKNIAAQKAVEAAMDVGIATKLPTSSGLPNVVVVHEKGVPTYYNCEDALFVNAVKSLGMSEIPFLNIIAAPANLLRDMVTKEPTFLLANMLRDSLSAYVTSGTNMVPVFDTFKNFGKALAGKSPEFVALTKAGILGGYDFAKGVDMGGRKFGEMLLQKADIKPNGVFPNVVGYGKSLWGVLEKGSSASDAATRMEIYKRTLAETGNETEAIFRSLEVMNFNRKGRNALVRLFTAMVPFLNARMQGLDILYRTALEPSIPGQPVSARQRQLQRSFFLRGAMMAGMSCLYWLMVHDDEEYKRQEQETKDNNWLLPGLGVRMPTPFEVGFFFKTVPERIMALTFGDDELKDFRESMIRGAVNTLKVVPIPLAVLPTFENMVNFSTFTGRPIVGPGTSDIAAGYQVNTNTSQVIADLGRELGISPIKIEHAIQGHTGQMGMYMVALIDAMWNANNPVQKPAKQFYQLPMIKRFAVDPEARGKLTQFYQLKNDVDEVVRTSNDMERSGKFDELDEYQKGKMALLDNKEYVLAIEQSLSDIRDQKKEILNSEDSPQDKADALLELQRMENDLVDNIQEIRKEAYGPD